MKNIAILASGNGTNAENIARLFNAGSKIRVSLVVTNRRKAGVIGRMEALGVPVEYVPNEFWDQRPQEVVDLLESRDIDLVVLAGFMHYVSPVIIEAYRDRIVNIHPSLLPKYGGKGMYGHHVHEAVIAAREKESGVTVHFVTEEMDAGDIIMQQRVDISPDDTAETLEAKIHPVEYNLYPRAIVAALDRQVPDVPETVQAPPKSPGEEWADVLQIKNPVIRDIPSEEMPPRYNPPLPQMPMAAVSAMAMTDQPPMPKSYLLWSIVMLVLCCSPAAIVAMVFSILVGSRYSAGDYKGAEKASNNAEVWIIISFILGIVWTVAMLPMTLLF